MATALTLSVLMMDVWLYHLNSWCSGLQWLIMIKAWIFTFIRTGFSDQDIYRFGKQGVPGFCSFLKLPVAGPNCLRLQWQQQYILSRKPWTHINPGHIVIHLDKLILPTRLYFIVTVNWWNLRGFKCTPETSTKQTRYFVITTPDHINSSPKGTFTVVLRRSQHNGTT
jgi:hypothetical protein